MGPRPRRMWRRVVRVLIALFALLVLLVAGVFLLIHTDWMRDKVRGILVEQLDKRLNGTVEVTRLEGDLLDGVTLRGLIVRDDAGREVARADSLTVDYRLLPLLDNHFHADLIAIDGLQATLHRLPDGRLAVADLWIQQPPGGEPWTTTIDQIRVERSLVALQRPDGAWDRVERIQIDGSVALELDETRVALRSLDAEYKAPDADDAIALAVAGDMRVPPSGGIELAAVEVSAGSSHVVVPSMRWDQRVHSAVFGADVSAADLKRFWKDSPLLADARIAGFASQDPASEGVRATLFGGSAGSALSAWAELTGDMSGGDVALFWAGVAPAELVTGAPEGKVDGWLAGDLTGLDRSSPTVVKVVRGKLQGGASGDLRGVKVSTLAFDAEVKDQVVIANLSARTSVGTSKARVRAGLPEDVADRGEVEVKESVVTAKVDDVAEVERLLGRPVSARGPVSIKAEAKGKLSDLTVEAKVTSDRLAQKELRLSGVNVTVDAKHLDIDDVPGRAVGTVTIRAGSIAQGRTSYGSATVVGTLGQGGERAELRFQTGGSSSGVSARGSLSARIEKDGARVTFHELRVATRDLVWQGKGGRLDVTDGGKKLAAKLSLASRAGSVAVSAELTKRGNDFHGPVRFQADRIDIGRILDQLDRTGLRGQIGARGEVRLPAGPGRVDIQANKLVWPGAPEPVSGRLHAELARRKLTATADVDGGELGKVNLQVSGRTPVLLTDAPGWKRLGTGAIASLRLKAEEVDMARWAHTLDDSPSSKRLLSGLADLEVQAGPALSTAKVSLALTGIEVAASNMTVPLTVKLEAEMAGRQAKAWAKAEAGDIGKVELDAALATPAQPFAAAGWRRQGLDLLESVRLRVVDFNLARLQPTGGKKIRRSMEMTGMVQAEVSAGRGARTLGAKVTFRDVRAMDLAAPVAGELSVQAQARSADLTVSVRVPSGPILDGSLAVGLGADLVRGLDFSRLANQARAASLRGQLRIPEQPVSRVASAMAAKPQVAGQLSGSLTVSGSIGKPIVAAKISAPGFTAQGVRFDQLGAEGTYKAGPWTVKAEARQSDGGRVLIDAGGSPNQRAPLKVHVSASRVRLGLFTPLWKRPGGMLQYLDGLLYADLNVRGTTAQPLIDGRVQVRGGDARIASFLRPVSKASVDVVFKRSRADIKVRANSRPGKLALDAVFDMRRPNSPSFKGTLTASRLPVEAGSQLVSINGKVSAEGSRPGAMWQVNVKIERGLVVRLPSQKGLKLHESGPLDDVVFVDAAGAAQEAAREELKRAAGPAMRMTIVSDDMVEVRSDELRLDMRVKLTMTQVGGVNVVDGTIEAERGWIEIVGRRYTIERALVIMAGEIPPDPRLDIRVSHQFPDALVFIDVTGRASQPQVSFASDSGAYDQAQLLGMILGGEGGGSGSLTDKAEGAAANVVASQVASMIRQAGLPVDALRIGTDTETQERYVTVGKWLTDRLFVAYSYRETTDTAKNSNEVTFQHFFTQAWMWEGTTGDKGATSLDLLWIVPLGR
jgi:autotransporter translocation and assembly factor TamB